MMYKINVKYVVIPKSHVNLLLLNIGISEMTGFFVNQNAQHLIQIVNAIHTIFANGKIYGLVTPLSISKEICAYLTPAKVLSCSNRTIY